MGACVSYRPESDESPAEVVARLIGSMARLSELPAEAALLVQPAALGQDAVQMMRLLAAAVRGRCRSRWIWWRPRRPAG